MEKQILSNTLTKVQVLIMAIAVAVLLLDDRLNSHCDRPDFKIGVYYIFSLQQS